ncbi:hypothetical protein AAU61_03615 [Desulfocarbo indianensis]|nr:hypothetical protein AAU61_03615 [Desulfocarbo indianensis]
MDCPHCQKELPALTCESCGRKALAGADFCHHCGHQLTGSEEPKLLTCSSCGAEALPRHKYCPDCGAALAPEDAHVHGVSCGECGQGLEEGDAYCRYCGASQGIGAEPETAGGFDPDQRIACSDGMCIGIIGPDGKCTECGKPFAGPAEATEE